MTTTATRPGGAPARAAIAAKTLRTDRWWFAAADHRRRAERLGRSTRLVRVYMHKWYWVEEYHYLTPFYSPCVTERCVPEAAHFGTLPARLVDHPGGGADACRSCCSSG